jgi:phage terminase large subunit-like protein
MIYRRKGDCCTAGMSPQRHSRNRSSASRVGGDMVTLIRGKWSPELHRDLLAFPASDHDDQVDAPGNIGNQTLFRRVHPNTATATPTNQPTDGIGT